MKKMKKFSVKIIQKNDMKKGYGEIECSRDIYGLFRRRKRNYRQLIGTVTD